MRLLLAFVLAMTGTAALAADNPDASPARLLAGRTAGEPRQCIRQEQIVDTQTFDDGSIYYRMAGGPAYLNRPHDCPVLNSRRAYVSSTPTGDLCSGDLIRVFDAMSHIGYGSCSLGGFVPYAKVRK